MGDGDFDSCDFRHHRRLFRRSRVAAEIAGNPVLKILGLAYINDLALGVDHLIDARTLGQRL